MSEATLSGERWETVRLCDSLDGLADGVISSAMLTPARDPSAAVREAKNRGQALVVSGCLPQRFREELPKLLPEVDAFMGIERNLYILKNRFR